MSTSFEFTEVDHLTAGAIGPPGERVFYLQAGRAGQLVTLRLEKTQVGALARYLAATLAELDPPGPLPTNMDLIEPVVAEWVVASLGVAYDAEADRFVLQAEELVLGEELADQPGESGEPGEMGGPPGGEAQGGASERSGPEPATVRVLATRAQVAALAMRGAAAVEAGRPPCPLCGGPLSAEGHVCPRLNGHRTPGS
ncbi:MAG: DUF3090 family protein [Acidimicrobiales bacterium]